jgi:C1A family cysteine protease
MRLLILAAAVLLATVTPSFADEIDVNTDTDTDVEIDAQMLAHMHSGVYGTDSCTTTKVPGFHYPLGFARFCKAFKKAYPGATYPMRYAVWMATYNCNQVRNAELLTQAKAKGKSKASYGYGENYLSDNTLAEIMVRMGAKAPVGTKPKPVVKRFRQVHLSHSHKTDAQTHARDSRSGKTKDWRDSKIIPPVGNQGQCGSCWAWCATSLAEIAWAQAGNPMKATAVQQFMDCANADDPQNGQCTGGRSWTGLRTAIKRGGLCDEADVTYYARAGACDNSCKKVVQLKTVTDRWGTTEEDLLNLLDVSPVGVSIRAEPASFMQYKFGVTDKDLLEPQKGINHLVVVVGYGTDPTTKDDYWVIMNSWGTGWGESGYIRAKRGKNMFLINTYWTTVTSDRAANLGIAVDTANVPAAVTCAGECRDRLACSDAQGKDDGSASCATTAAERGGNIVCCVGAKLKPATPPTS